MVDDWSLRLRVREIVERAYEEFDLTSDEGRFRLARLAYNVGFRRAMLTAIKGLDAIVVASKPLWAEAGLDPTIPVFPVEEQTFDEMVREAKEKEAK